MGRTAYSSAKNFGKIGAMFAGIECGIEGLRGKNDLYNGTMAGGLTGALLARKGPPSAWVLGGVGFAAFSLGIDWYMKRGEGERRFPVE